MAESELQQLLTLNQFRQAVIDHLRKHGGGDDLGFKKLSLAQRESAIAAATMFDTGAILTTAAATVCRSGTALTTEILFREPSRAELARVCLALDKSQQYVDMTIHEIQIEPYPLLDKNWYFVRAFGVKK